ncbi:MAG: class I SAM-dependent methyltransferase [Verrucomicrobium sp.]|nr:class I SAM-dependent methyltransferase [Verrucomicrobium sp.]
MAQNVRCLLCHHGETTVADSLTPADIGRLWNYFGVTLGPEALASFRGAERVTEHRCAACGFEFFDPVLPGNGAFYADLQSQVARYYPPDSPSFLHAIGLASRAGSRDCLDLGCGDGGFLDLARSRGLETHGLDLTPKAVAAARAKGHDVHASTAEEYARTHADRKFSLVTAFEVMEHVPDPVAFFRDAANLVAPGGHLVLSVPHGRGIYRWWTLEPCQWPPHHITHWRRADLERLGTRHGLEPVWFGADPLRGVQVRLSLQTQGDLEHLLGRRPSKPSRLWTEGITFLYRAALCRHYLPWGTSLHAHYRRPAGA